MAEEKLPRGYVVSDGKTEINGVVHPEGTTVGPQEAPEETKTFVCPTCKNEMETTADTVVCNGLGINVNDAGRVYDGKIGDTHPLSADEVRSASHSPTVMEVK